MFSGVPFPAYYFDRAGQHPHATPVRGMADALDVEIGPQGGELLLRVLQFQQPQQLAEQLGHVVCGLLPAALSDWLLEQEGVESPFRIGSFSQALTSPQEVVLNAAGVDSVRERVVGAFGWFMAREVGQDPKATPTARIKADAARLYDLHDPLLRLFEVPVRFTPGPTPGGRLLRALLEQGHVGFWPQPWATSLDV
jgi:hypothetical protein